MLRKTALLIFLLFVASFGFAADGQVIEFLLGGLSTQYTGALNGGSVYSYSAGTTNPKAIYADQALSEAYDNPATLDTDGRLVAYGSGNYKFIIKDSSGNTIFTADNVEVESVEAALGDDTDPFGPDLTQTNLTVTNLAASDAQVGTMNVTGAAVIASLSMDGNRITDVASATADTDVVIKEQLDDVQDLIFWTASGSEDITTDKNIIIDGDITATGNVRGNRSGVFACLSTPASVTATLADTWYPVPGTFTNDPMEDFSLATDSIQYDGDITRYYKVVMCCAIESDDSSTLLQIGLKINGVIQPCSEMSTFARNVNERYNLASVCVFELENGDQIQLVVKCDQAGAVLTVNNFTTTIKEFFD